MAFAAVGALIGGAAASTALVLGAMAEVGMAMSVVGAITGSKSLIKLGGLVGLVGGVGGMINGATSASAAAAADAATSAASPTAWNSAGIAGSDSMAIGGLEAGMGSAAQAMPVSGPANIEAQTLAPWSESPVTTTQQAAGTTQQAASTTGQYAGPSGATGPQGPITVQGPGAIKDAGAEFARNNADYATKGDSFFGDIGRYLKDPANSGIVKSGVDLLGGAFQGANEADMWDRKMSLEEVKFEEDKLKRANVNTGQNQSRSGIIQTARA